MVIRFGEHQRRLMAQNPVDIKFAEGGGTSIDRDL